MTASPDPLVGRTLAGRYLVEKRIGMGGMGAVYVGTQHPLGRKVAIKVLLGGLAADTSARERFQREATAVASLNHPGIVTVYDFGQTDDGTWFIAMEFVAGQTLKSVLDTHKRLAWPRAVDIARQTATALAVAHDQGIVHRDLKPENIMLVPQGDGTFLVKILDFGLAKLAEGREGGPLGQPLTQRSVIMGTPGYMSPEQIQGQAIDHRCDLYALGAILWEMVVGHQPLRDDNPIKILMRHLAETIPAPSSARPDAAIPGRGDALIMRLLEKDRERRPQRTADVAAALLALASEPWVAPAAVALDAAPDPGDWDIAFKALDEVPAPKKAAIGTPDGAATAVLPFDAMPSTAGQSPTAVLPPPPTVALPPATTAQPAHPATMAPPPPPPAAAPGVTAAPSSTPPTAPAPFSGPPSTPWSPPPPLLPAPSAFGPPPSAFGPPPSVFGPPPLSAGPGLQLAGPKAAALEIAGPARPATRMTSTGAGVPTRPAAGPGIPDGMKKALLALGLLTMAAAVHFVVRGGLDAQPLLRRGGTTTPRAHAADLDEAVAARERTGTRVDLDAALERARTDAVGPLGSARVAGLLVERARLRGDLDSADEREARALLISMVGDDAVVRRARGALLGALGGDGDGEAVRLLEGLPDDPRARLLLAELLWRTDPQRARSLLARGLPTDLGTRPARVQGAVALAFGELAAAGRFLDERLGAVADDATARGLRALVRLGQQNRAAARADVDAAFAAGPAVTATLAALQLAATEPTAKATAFDKARAAVVALPARHAGAARAALLDALRARKDRGLATLVDDKSTLDLARNDIEVAVARGRALLALQRRDEVPAMLRPFAGDGLPPATQSRVAALVTRARLGPQQGDDAFVKVRPLSPVAALAAAPADVAAALPLWVAAPVPLPSRLDDDERLVLDGPPPKDPVARAMRELALGSGASLAATLKSRPKDPAVLLLAAAQDLDSGRLDDVQKKLLAVGSTGLDPRMQEAALVVGARLAAAKRAPDAIDRATALREGPVRDLVVLSVRRLVGDDPGAAVAAIVARDVLSARARELVE